MRFFRRMSPVRAVRDLRVFLAGRERYELAFLALAMAITGFFVYAMMRNDYVPPTYQPDIVYVQQWRADRTDAEIVAAQKIDQAVKAKREAAEEARRAKVRAQFKTVDDAMNRWGL